MNRREFTRGLATLGLTPALPLGALGTGSTGAAVATATADKLYFVGWYTARLNKTCSPDMLVSELNVGKDVASEIFGKLIQSNTVSAPDAFGVSRTISPLSESYRRMAGKAARRVVSDKATKLKRDALEKAKEFASSDAKDAQDAAQPPLAQDASVSTEPDHAPGDQNADSIDSPLDDRA